MNTENKNIILRENGVPRAFSVNELAIKDSVWSVPQKYIPADRYDLATAEFNKNGTFTAKQFGADGFSRVKVNITLPYEGETRSGVKYEIYEDVTEKPHIKVYMPEDNG